MRKAPPASPEEPEFDFGHHLPAGMETFTVRWLAMWFKCSPQHWINLIEQGTLRAVDLASPGTSKSMRRIPRAALIAYLNSKTE